MPVPEDSNSLFAWLGGGLAIVVSFVSLANVWTTVARAWGRMSTTLEEHEKRLEAHSQHHKDHYATDEKVRADIAEVSASAALMVQAVKRLEALEDRRVQRLEENQAPPQPNNGG